MKKRVFYYDVLRSIAILLVVLCHSVESTYTDILVLSSKSQIFRIVGFTLGRLGVPIFLFLTGALILNKKFDSDDDIKKFYIHNLFPLFITMEIWIVIYSIFNAVLYKNFSIQLLIRDMLLLRWNNMPHMWYLPTIIGIYVALPFLSRIIKKCSPKLLMIPLIISCIAHFVIPTINIFGQIFCFENASFVLDTFFLGSCYGIYVIIGYYLSNGVLEKIKTGYLIMGLSITFLITVWIQYYSINTVFIYNVWYDFVPLLICSIFLYEFIRRIFVNNKSILYNNEVIRNGIIILSRSSLAVFFFHEIFLMIYSEYFSLNLSKPFIVIMMFISSFLSSIFVIKICSKSKFIKNHVLLIK